MSRRAFLQVGYSGLLGLGLPGLLAARGAAAAGAKPGRARSVIVILLSGGLGQHDSFDMKPEAPEAMRGEFKPIETAVPGIRICEHLPGLAARAGQAGDRPLDGSSRGEPPAGGPSRADRPAVQSARGQRPRSGRVARRFPLLCGRARPASGAATTASPTAWPCRSAWSKARSPGPARTPASSARATIPGSSASTPIGPTSRDDSLALPAGLDPDRLHRRRHLLGPVDPCRRPAIRSSISRMRRSPCSATARSARPSTSTAKIRACVDRYGRHLVRPVAPDRPPAGRGRRADRAGDDGDRADLGHARRQLPPPARRACCRRSTRPSRPCSTTSSARGLLDETLVVMLGEFGRTPRISRADARRRPRPRPLAVRLPGRLRRRGRGRRPGHRQVRPPGRLSGLPHLRPARPGRDDLHGARASTRPPSSATASAARSGSARARSSIRSIQPHRSDPYQSLRALGVELRFSPWKGRHREVPRPDRSGLLARCSGAAVRDAAAPFDPATPRLISRTCPASVASGRA